MNREYAFEDGSSIAWVDKETLRYSDGKGTATVWVDFEPGLLSRGRVIHEASIRHWQLAESGREEPIDEFTKTKIIDKIRAYYARRRIKCRVEP